MGYKIKPLDFIYPMEDKSTIGIVQEVTPDGRCSVEWLNDWDDVYYNAWWYADDLTTIDSLPKLLTRLMAHPFGNSKNMYKNFFND